MKNLLYVLTALLIFSCSSSDDSSSASSSAISPPSWIQGRWIMEGVSNSVEAGYNFSKNDFCLIVFNTQTCFKESNNLLSSGGGYIKVEEVVNENEYKISITQISSTFTYHFKKITPTKIEWINGPLGTTQSIYYVKQ
jgi:hypothetical protein